MFAGVSKNLGHGFRVGIGGRLQKPKSAGELAKETNDAFITSANQRMVGAFLRWLHSHGICIASKDVGVFTLPDDLSALMLPAADSIASYELRQKMYRDTGKISQANKEKALASLYDVETFFDKTKGDVDIQTAVYTDAKSQLEVAKPPTNSAWSTHRLLYAASAIVFLIVGFTEGKWPALTLVLPWLIIGAIWAHIRVSKANKKINYRKDIDLNTLPLGRVRLWVSQPFEVLVELNK